jgi:hypothetical protein
MNDQRVSWLLLLYSMPAEPSAPRVQVWRRINELGALRLPSGGYVLPDHERNRLVLSAVEREITTHGGAATLFCVHPLAAELSAGLREDYDAARVAEYAAIEHECGRLRDHIQREIEHFVFTYEEFEELEAELQKIRTRLEVVEQRDVFAVPARASALTVLAACEQLLASFTQEIAERTREDGTPE